MWAVAAQPRTGLTPMIPTPSVDLRLAGLDVTAFSCSASGEGPRPQLRGCGRGAQRRECGAPGDDLLEERVQRREVVVAGLEDAEVLELGDQRQDHLLAHVGHLQLAGNQA